MNFDEPIEEIKDRIKKALEIRNMKPVELSEQTGISKSSLSHYMSGKVEPKQNRIYKIAKVLNVSEAWLMGYDVPMVAVDPLYEGAKESVYQQTLISKFNELNDEGKDQVMDYIEFLLSKGIYKKSDSVKEA